MLAEFEEFSPEQVDAVLSEAQHAFDQWHRTSFEKRAALMRRAVSFLRQHKERLAGLITAEMGKPIVEAEAEIEKCAWTGEFSAEHAARFLADEPVVTNARESIVAFEPFGTVLAIMPWNFPFWQVFRFALPALMAGNTAVLKHASNVTQCTLAIEEVFQEAGFPQGTFRTLLVASSTVDGIIKDSRIAAVTLTGSEAVGSSVARTAGEALKKSVLELGGSDPFIVLADADLDGAVEFAVRSRFQNGGQSCISAKRFIVVEEVAEAFEYRFAEVTSLLRVGDPTRLETQIGPMARGDLRENLDRQVRESVQQGARILQGGKSLGDTGYFYAPTVLVDVQPTMVAFQEETFGPIAAVVRVRDSEEAIAVANASPYGLGGNLWTSNSERGKQLARRIESGSVFINGMTASDPRLPFGGIKRSGYGRELSSFGIREFVNIQTIWVGPTQDTAPALPAGE
jgi:succinate-semialdehyde dehydrogenase / glutarate-semialdehyde dehydrogenase